MSGPPVRMQIQLQTDLMEEFVFGELEKLKQQKKPVSLQEFQLIEVMSTFFRAPERPPAVRNAVFLFLYPAESTRFKILGNLVSLAIATQNKEVLDSTGMWMQQLGSTSVQSVDLARHILDDFFVYTPNAVDKLKQLPTLVPHFTANFLTAVGEVFKDKDPSNELLKLAGDWIDENPSLLLTSLMDNPALPTGGIPMTPITPIAGLFRWCILGPARKTSESVGQEMILERNKSYSKIQQLLMDSVLRLNGSGNNKHAISAQHLADTTRTLSNILQSSDDGVAKNLRDLAMERLAQAVSTAMSANCIYGNKRKIFSSKLFHLIGKLDWNLTIFLVFFCDCRGITQPTAAFGGQTLFDRMDVTNIRLQSVVTT